MRRSARAAYQYLFSGSFFFGYALAFVLIIFRKVQSRLKVDRSRALFGDAPRTRMCVLFAGAAHQTPHEHKY